MGERGDAGRIGTVASHRDAKTHCAIRDGFVLGASRSRAKGVDFWAELPHTGATIEE